MSTLRTNILTTLDDSFSIEVKDIASNPDLLDLKSKVGNFVSNIASLKSLLKTGNPYAHVGGYYQPGDGGGGYYYLDIADTTTADNGGSVIVATDGGRWKLVFTAKLTARQFGALHNGTDDTVRINAAITALPVGGVLSGEGLTYSVKSLLLKSNMEMEDFYLSTLAGAEDFVSPITINGTSSAKTNIKCRRIFVDGNRANQTNILAAAEDGGRHGWRLVGSCSKILIEDCSGNNCAGDGMEIYSSTSAGGADSIFVFRDINIVRFQGNGNRRHGFVADSITGLRIKDSQFNNNGLDQNTIDPYTTGTRGARFPTNLSGSLYGQGIDIEGYGIGSCVNNIRISSVEAIGNNRMGCLFLDAATQTAPGFVPRQAIFIDNCYFDSGSGVGQSNYDGAALEFTSTIANAALAALYQDIIISDCRLGGKFLARSANNVIVNGGQITWSGDSEIATLDHATNVVLSTQVTGSATAINAVSSSYTLGPEVIKFPANPGLQFVSGPAGTLSSVAVTQVQNLRTRIFEYVITASWSGAAGVPVFQVTAPVGTTLASPPKVDVLVASTALAIPCAYSSALNNFRFNDPGTGAISLQLVVQIKV